MTHHKKQADDLSSVSASSEREPSDTDRPSTVSAGQKKTGRLKTLGKKMLLLLTILLLASGAAWGVRSYFFSGHSSKANIIEAKVTRGTFLHKITGKGNAESAKNIDITCQVENAGGTTVIWIIPEGEMVEEDDELVLLDSSDLEDKANTQQITCNTNAATVASSQASLRTAELSLEEYIEGTFEENWMTIENNIYEAQEKQKQAADTVRYTEKLVQFGYQTISQLEANQVSEQQYINTVRSILLQQLVLLRYTSEKQITQLMANIETARAKLNSDTYTNELAKSRLDHYKQQLKNCTIVAPQAGQVVYANQDSRRWTSESDMIKEGSTVRERQVLIRLPDPKQMQVKAMVNESNIAYVKVGMKVHIVFDALSSRSFEGTVIKVNQYPEISWMSSAKDYVTIIKIENSTPEIRSGLTAEVSVESQRLENVLMLPVQCVVEQGGKNYVLTHHEKTWGVKEIKIGLSNDKQIIIEAGLDEGESVVSGARQYKDKVKFPAADEPSLFPKNPSEETANAAPSENAKAPAEQPAMGGGPADIGGGPGGMGSGPAGMGSGPAGMGSGPAGMGSGPAGMAGGPGDAGGGMPFGNLMKDGKIEISALPEQLPQMIRDQIKKADKNKDGFLDESELKALPKPPAGGPRQERRRPNEGPSEPHGEGEQPSAAPTDTPPTEKTGEQPSAASTDTPPTEKAGEQPSAAPSTDAPQERSLTEAQKIQEENQRQVVRLEPLCKYFDFTAMELCQLADEDNSKIITREELGAKFPEMLPFFDEWDRNGDGQLSRTDLVIGFCSSRIAYQKFTAVEETEESPEEENQTGMGGMKELIAQDPNETFSLLDTDKDGFLTESEAPNKNVEMFKNLLTKMDGDGDKKLSREEFSKEIKKLQKIMGQGGGSTSSQGSGGGPPPPPR